MNIQQALKQVEKFAKSYAQNSPYHLHPDQVVVRNVLYGLAKNLVKYSKRYCPCRPVTGKPEKDKFNICPCSTHKKDIVHSGTCECGLFVSSEYLQAKKI